MALRKNTFEVRRALAGAGAIGQAASNFGQITRATKILVLNSRLHDALSRVPRLIAPGTVAWREQTAPAIANSERLDSSIGDESTKPERAGRRHNSAKASKSDSSFPNLKILLGIFASMYRSLAFFPSRDRQTHQENRVNRDKGRPGPLADAKQSAARLSGQLAAPFVPAFKRALVRGTQIVNEMAEFLKNKPTVATLMKWAVYALGAQWLLGWAADFIKSIVSKPLQEGFRAVQSAIFALRWLLVRGASAALPWLSILSAAAAQYVAMFAELSLGWYVVIAGLAVAGYEPYRHWAAAKRLLSRWMESAHRAVAHLMKWMADKTRNAAAYTGNSIASVTAAMSNALDLPSTTATAARMATATRDLNSARAVERAAAIARPVLMPRAVRRAAAAAAFAAPLMLAGASTGALATPLISTNDTARIAVPLSTSRMTQGSIVINYAPNVVIHSEDAADKATLTRRIMEVLERHGRELHQVLTREIVRRQRGDFQPGLSTKSFG